ncbi:hypothetical protein [Streptomyces endophytica]|uniref:Aminoglycoside phosphotransferase domain-containing protein n=1 Tax=Streptomyces endophytica TaxID=2991496 RepID=A0ABY6PE77_9ACTN|nr:hypothetical protein [Streptomyces endophytica]UZJ31690.1 hypothetical protein OJ254_17100 [Streptomyces endophytica]
MHIAGEERRTGVSIAPRQRIQEGSADGWVYRAELYEYVATPPVSRSPVLQHSVELSGAWWHNLHQALDLLSHVPTSREAVREQYIHRRVPEFTGITPGEIAWTTGHGDLHWANLTSPPLSLLDWEGWGAAPVGYDAANLYLHFLPIPDLAERVRVVYSDLADSVRQYLDHLS